MKLTKLIPLLLLLSSNTVLSEQQYYRYKCYAVYLGGGDGIHFLSTSNEDIAAAYRHFENKKVKSNKNKPVQIYKVEECVRAKDKFKRGRAQQLFDTMAQ